MIVKISELSKVICKARPLLPTCRQSSLKFLLKLITSFKNKFNGDLISIEWLANNLALCGLVKRFQDIRQLYGLAGVLKPLNFLDQLQLKKFLRIARSAGNKRAKNPKLIPSGKVFINTIRNLDKSGKGKAALLLLVMLSSGRRAVDVSRVNSLLVRPIGKYKYSVVLPFDKKNAKEIKFKIDFNAIPASYLPVDLEKIDQSFRAELQASIFPFEVCGSKNLSRLFKFKPHSLRSLFSINLTRLGFEDGRIMKIAGWRDLRSLQLYRRLGRFEFVGKDLPWLVKKANRAGGFE